MRKHIILLPLFCLLLLFPSCGKTGMHTETLRPTSRPDTDRVCFNTAMVTAKGCMRLVSSVAVTETEFAEQYPLNFPSDADYDILYRFQYHLDTETATPDLSRLSNGWMTLTKGEEIFFSVLVSDRSFLSDYAIAANETTPSSIGGCEVTLYRLSGWFDPFLYGEFRLGDLYVTCEMNGEDQSAMVELVQALTQKTAPDSLVTHIQISSGDNTIRPFGRLMWSKTDNGDGTFTEQIADTFDVVSLVSGQTAAPVTDIPTLILGDRVTYAVQVNGRVENVRLLTSDSDLCTETTFDALSDLPHGTYYVVFDVLLSGNCDPDAPQHAYRYEDVFRLVVGE